MNSDYRLFDKYKDPILEALHNKLDLEKSTQVDESNEEQGENRMKCVPQSTSFSPQMLRSIASTSLRQLDFKSFIANQQNEFDSLCKSLQIQLQSSK